MSALCAQKALRDLRVALFLYFLVDFRKAKIKKGFSRSAERDLRLCLKTPQTFEKV